MVQGGVEICHGIGEGTHQMILESQHCQRSGKQNQKLEKIADGNALCQVAAQAQKRTGHTKERGLAIAGMGRGQGKGAGGV